MDDLSCHQKISVAPTFSLSHRTERLLFALVWMVLARWTPPQLRKWRLLLLRIFGARIATTANVYSSVSIWRPRNLEMGENACLGPHVRCYCMAPITLRANALVSQGAHLCAGTHDIRDPRFPLVTSPIEIGPGAWVATEAFVGPGVTIGGGAVLGARGVTTKDLAAGGVYVGNPAQHVRDRLLQHPV